MSAPFAPPARWWRPRPGSRARRPAPRRHQRSSLVHSIGCSCRHCAPARRLSWNAIALLAIAGLATGLLLAAVIDRAISGPGIGVIFGQHAIERPAR